MRLSVSERMMAEAGIIAAIGAVFALFNLFNPEEMALGARMAYWIAGFLAAWVVVRIVSQIGTASAKLIGLSRPWGYAITIPLSTAVISWSVLWLQGGPQLAASEAFGRIWPSTILVGIGFFALFFVLYSRVDFSSEAQANRVKSGPIQSGPVQSGPVQSSPDQSGVDPAGADNGHTAAPETPLHERLPAGFPEILALSVEDHYTRVHAATRSEMVLMPLGEAITLLPPQLGEQVHRSWWVARSSVEGHKREGRDIKLTLTNGLEVPVSRSKVQTLREAGWLG